MVRQAHGLFLFTNKSNILQINLKIRSAKLKKMKATEFFNKIGSTPLALYNFLSKDTPNHPPKYIPCKQSVCKSYLLNCILGIQKCFDSSKIKIAKPSRLKEMSLDELADFLTTDLK